MSRYRLKLPQTDESELKNRLIRTCGASEYGLFLDSHDHSDRYSKYKWLAAYDSIASISTSRDSLDHLVTFQSQHRDWMLGHISFELKNELEDLQSQHPDQLGFPNIGFFVPKYLIYHNGGEIILETREKISIKEFLSKLSAPFTRTDAADQSIELSCLTTEEEYQKTVEELTRELQLGNIYEINYCIEFAARKKIKNPAVAFLELNTHTEAPFTGFYKLQDKYLLCASPERYLQRAGSNLISQPMKGTARRDRHPKKDQDLKIQLTTNEKERSENVMITDLVRNDLSKIARKGSVKVDELFAVFTYKSVHQMLSTISCKLKESESLKEILQATFPMGSMTGAPKISALRLIDQYEKFQRGLYAGSIGYIDPEGDFDLNVVIRSLLYNDSVPYLSARVGSAITIHSEAQKEYEECLLKAESLLKALRKEGLSAS